MLPNSPFHECGPSQYLSYINCNDLLLLSLEVGNWRFLLAHLDSDYASFVGFCLGSNSVCFVDT